MKVFDVALWRRWPSLFPERVGIVEAENAYSAVVQVMHTYGYTRVEHAAAIAKDGSIAYRAFRVSGVPRGWVWFEGRRAGHTAYLNSDQPMS